ncbi:MAG: ABC transporter ATP-binding protein [Eubacterium sp.]|jgi:ABC-2 type transport system ATP-binding protein|nr:ABC transporter ATP-binding protein [Eubacterium sp.]
MLELEHVLLKYRKKEILRDVTFSAKPGQAIGLLGLNGSGKSTILSAIAGAKSVSGGTIRLEGKTYHDDPKLFQRSIGYVTQENALIDELSAMDNIRLWTPLDKAAIYDTLTNTNLSILGVHTFLEVPVRSMSGGMKKRLSIATVLINKPHILLLDEPLAALDIVAKESIRDYIFSFRSNGGILLIASHDEKLFEFCDEVWLLHDHQCTSLRDYPADVSISDLLRRS